MEKIDNMKEQIGSISWEMETLGKQVIHMQNYLGGLTRRWKNGVDAATQPSHWIPSCSLCWPNRVMDGWEHSFLVEGNSPPFPKLGEGKFQEIYSLGIEMLAKKWRLSSCPFGGPAGSSVSVLISPYAYLDRGEGNWRAMVLGKAAFPQLTRTGIFLDHVVQGVYPS